MLEQLREALLAGQPLDMRPSRQSGVNVRHGRRWGPRRQVEAALVIEMLGDPQLSRDRERVPLRLIGARITGSLDLGHVRVARPLFVECCYFDESIELFGAQLAWLSLRDCTAPTIIGHGLRLEGDLDLGGATIDRVNLFGAEVKGQIWLNGARLGGDTVGHGLSAPLLKVGGGMYCRNGFVCDGGMNLFGAAIGSTLEFAGARLTNSAGLALRAPGLSVAADVELNGEFTAGRYRSDRRRDQRRIGP
jgi:hypothetical protein